ncbi:hypothetical protein LKO27_03815 [Tessaracoccus sp. OS52]|uniref:hypothetical protein n=1 Tax=Tessaracoccus sp. OS52 TaxID=2886691 RepID=UPI001D11ABA3|nr:hypothetical protein [Tessaracoccus sp. OS52]MCC2592546.1 hypothetical protein [Tessaracoccus sp. OS52]
MTTPPSHLIEFPDVTDRMATVLTQLGMLQQGGRAADVILSTGEILPRLWDLTTIHDPHLRLDTWNWLEKFAIWFNSQQTWFSQDQIPACWTEHPHLVRDIAALADQRRAAGEALTSTPLDEWHRYTVPLFLERTRPARGNCEDKHTPWPGRAAHNRHLNLENQQARRASINADIEALKASHHPTLRALPPT